MNSLHLRILIFFVKTSLLTTVGFSADFYVSPTGNDSNPGTKGAPFASIHKGVEIIAGIFDDNPNEDCTLWLAGGKYFLEKPIVLDHETLKNLEGKFIIKAMPGETPIVSGGIEINGWEKLSSGLWKAKLWDLTNRKQIPRELFVGDKRATRARFPNEGYLHVAKAGADHRTHFFFESNDFPIPASTKDVELVFFHDWSISRIPIKEIDISENKLTAVDSIGAKGLAFFTIDNWEPHPRYYLENAMEFLDADYEWYFQPSGNDIYLKLPENLSPNEQTITIPYVSGLVIMEGIENQPLRNIHFEGIVFEHSAWHTPTLGYCGVQACHFDPRPEHEGWSIVPSAIKGEWTQNCSFVNCTFQKLGGSGVSLGAGSKGCTISNCHFSDISGNGMMIGEGRERKVNGETWWKVAPEQAALGNTIENCIITTCGQQFYGAVGIWCGFTAETTIRNNTISDLPYTGISIGWEWSPAPTPCRDNIIEGNHIHHIMQVLSDGGGIYMLGLQPGSKIVNNRIHDVELNAGRAESNGMFLDEGTTDVVVSGNLIYNIAKSPLRFHRATINLVERNYLFCGEDTPPIRYNSTKEDDIQKISNYVFQEDDSRYRKQLKKATRGWDKRR
ncbi:MAG: right-handed parallel beta-helix repeat-containing protein [Bacteroidota bacterium]